MGGAGDWAELAEDACLPRCGWYTPVCPSSRSSFAFSPISPLHTSPGAPSSSFLSAIATMDSITNRDNVFSRGPATPPPPSSQFQVVPHVPGPSSEPHVSPALSHREIAAPNTVQSHLDSLLHNLNAPSASHVSPQPSIASASIYQGPQEQPTSGPATPASGNAASISSNVSGPSNQATERQNALLSLLGAVSPPSSNLSPFLPWAKSSPRRYYQRLWDLHRGRG